MYLGNVLSAALPMEGDKCWQQASSAFLQTPLPSALCPPGRDGNWNCKHLLPIYFSLTVPSCCLQEHPSPFRSSEDRKWRVPAVSLSPFHSHKWSWKVCHCSRLTGCLRERPSAHNEAQAAVTEAYLRSQGLHLSSFEERCHIYQDGGISKATNL